MTNHPMLLFVHKLILCTCPRIWLCEAGANELFAFPNAQRTHSDPGAQGRSSSDVNSTQMFVSKSLVGSTNAAGLSFRSSHVMPCSTLEWLVHATRRRRAGQKSCKTPPESSQDVDEIRESFKSPDDAVSMIANMQLGISRSFLAGFSTSVGAIVVIMSPTTTISNNYIAFVLSLAAGVMASATVLEFWLPLFTSYNLAQDAMEVVFYSSIGFAAFALLSWCLGSGTTDKDADIEKAVEVGGSEQCQIKVDAPRFDAMRSSTVLMFTLTLHNFPEGFAVGMSSLGNQQQCFTIMLAIAVHNIPEGIAIAAPILAATGSCKRAFGMTLLSGLAEPAGASMMWVLVHMTGAVSLDSIQKILCVVGGIMLAVVVMELIPDALHLAKTRVCAIGFAVGCVVMSVTVAAGA